MGRIKVMYNFNFFCYFIGCNFGFYGKKSRGFGFVENLQKDFCSSFACRHDGIFVHENNSKFYLNPVPYSHSNQKIINFY